MGMSTMHIQIPASGAYLSVVRAAATGLAAQLQFTYEEIDDLRIAVDEACAQLLARRGSAETLRIDYHLKPAELFVEVSVEAPDRGEPLERDTFAWQILTALTDEVTERAEADGLRLSFRKCGGRA
ncbi:MAG TPA: ATP-binding protein [Actinomycetes bacterium]|jgi:serine/threonine-protein kinase RsbW|nr:ATP-binding protein [Actinomycetes bacterium]